MSHFLWIHIIEQFFPILRKSKRRKNEPTLAEDARIWRMSETLGHLPT
jgi:hypothetical protein